MELTLIFWAFLVCFVLCLGVGTGAVLLAYRGISTYNSAFHRRYFYYLVSFYGFGVYGIWGQVAFLGVVVAGDTAGPDLAPAGTFLAVLGIPFLFLSCGMLAGMGYALHQGYSERKKSLFHFLLLIIILTGMWTTYFIWYRYEFLNGPTFVYLEIALLLALELGYLIVFARGVFQSTANGPKKRVLRKFTGLMGMGWIFRALALPFIPEFGWLSCLMLLLYFLSNGLPSLYLHIRGEEAFSPVGSETPNEAKKVKLYQTYSLTPREREIVEQLCQGKTNQQIADSLFISLQTVKDHTHRIYSKIGIHSRLKLVQLING